MSTLWDQTLAELRLALPRQDFAAWISCLRMTDHQEDGLITVEAPNVFHRNWVQQHFLDQIRSTVESVAGKPVPVSLAVGVTPITRGPRRLEPIVDRRSATTPRTLTPTFETFVTGPSNELAYAAAHAVSDAPGKHYNPLFIHGGVGLGKTHLIHGVANAVQTRFRNYRVVAIGAELFINEMVSALRRQQMETFHHRFRRIDILLVDDVQFIAGKERTQEEFLHTFNLLGSAGKQIVVSSDKPPRAIPNLEAGLRSRFEGGMMAEVTAPDRDTRRRILERKAAAADLALSDAVLDFLADRVQAVSVRELEGALTRLKAIAALSGRPFDVALAEEAVGPMYPDSHERLAPGRIEALVGDAFHIDHDDLQTGRSARVVVARQVVMYLLRKRVGLALATIGERYDRDHTTVLHAVRAVEARRACDPEIRRLVTALEEKL